MTRAWAFLLLVLVAPLLGGCLDPVPDDAVRVSLEGHEGLVLWGWVEDDGDQTVFRGRFENGGDDPVILTYGVWPKPWQVDLQDAQGTSLPFTNVETRNQDFDDRLGVGDHEEFRLRWNRILYDHHNETTSDAPAGDYTFILGIRIKQERANAFLGNLTVEVPFRLAAAPAQEQA